MKRSEFCRARGLSLGTLRRHLKGGKQKAKQPPRLVAVELEENATQRVNAIEVVLGRGRRVEVRPGFERHQDVASAHRGIGKGIRRAVFGIGPATRTTWLLEPRI